MNIKIALHNNVMGADLNDKEVEVYSFWSSDGPPMHDARWGRSIRHTEDEGKNTADEGAMDPQETLEQVLFEMRQFDLKVLHFEEREFKEVFESLLAEQSVSFTIIGPPV